MRKSVVGVLLGLLALSCDSPTVDPSLDAGVATVQVQPTADTILVADAPLKLTAKALNAGGVEVAGTHIVWKSSAPSIATVDSTGLVLGIAPGSATITASIGSKDGQASVVVSPFTVLAGAGACAAAGTNHGAAIDNPTTWTRAASPHHVLRTISVRNTLTIEPGAVICAYPAAMLEMRAGASPGVGGEILALGTAQNPIVFTAQDPAQYWGGLSISEFRNGDPDETHISHAVIEYAVNGVFAVNPVTVDNSHIRQIQQVGVYLTRSGGRVAFCVIDSVAGTGIVMTVGTAEENLIRGSGDSGIALGGGSLAGSVTLNGGRIENSGGIGLVAGYGFRSAIVVAGRPIRVVGSKSYGAQLALSALLAMYPTRADQDSLLGNAIDTLYTGGAMGSGEVIVRRDLPWVIGSNQVGDDALVGQGGTIRAEPGASITIGTRLALTGGRLVARGTANAPISVSGGGSIVLSDAADTSFLTNANVNRVRLIAFGENPLVIENSALSNGSSVELRSRGSRIAGSSVSSGASNNFVCRNCSPVAPLASVILGAPGVSLAQTSVRSSVTHAIVIDSASVVVSGCAVSGNNGDAVRVTASGGAAIHACNFEQNVGAGVNNLGTAPVDAISNWWGDPAGPTGPNGDGVAGNVTYQPYRTSPSAN